MTLFPALRRSALPQDAGVYRFVNWMKGGSGSLLVEDSLDRKWVIKPYENFQGHRVLCNEVLGAVFLRAAGLPSLPWRRVRLDDNLIAEMRRADKRLETRAFDTEQFASLFVGAPTCHTSPISCVPEDEAWIQQLLGLYVFDIWAAHADSREVLVAMNMETSQVSLLAIDNGHLFYGPKPLPVLPHHVRQRLSLTMKTLVAQDSSLPVIEWWIEHLRFVLPAFIDLEVQSSDRPWGTNELLQMPDRFRARLECLEELVFTDREVQMA